MALKKPVLASNTETAAAVEETKMTTEGVSASTVVEEVATEQAEQVETTAAAAEPETAATESTVDTPAEVETETAAVSTDVAVAQPTQVVAARSNAMAEFTKAQAENGFEGLELTGMSFDRVKLHEGKFLIGSEEAPLGEEFDCIVHSTRNIYVVRQSTDNDAEAYYSYDADGSTFTDGQPAREKLEEWAEDGYGGADAPLDIRKYLEAMATICNRDDEYEGQMIILSIPPSSKARLSGAAAQAYTRLKGASLDQVVTRCVVGKKIGEGQKAFRPWIFKVVGRIEE